MSYLNGENCEQHRKKLNANMILISYLDFSKNKIEHIFSEGKTSKIVN